MSQPEIVYLDLTNCRDTRDLHQRIKETFDFPDFYGENWSAFWDCIMCETPVDYVEIRGEHTVAEDLIPALEIVHKLLQKAKEKQAEYGWEFDYVIVD